MPRPTGEGAAQPELEPSESSDASERLPTEIEPAILRTYVSLTRADLDEVERCRGAANKLGFIICNLLVPLPTGYVRRPSGEVTLDPDEQVQHVIRLIFRKFDELGTVYAVLRYLMQHQIQIGVRVRTRSGKGELEWRLCSDPCPHLTDSQPGESLRSADTRPRSCAGR